MRSGVDAVSDLTWAGDVLVIGGGSAGCSAAVAAARLGATTLLVESGGFLGGTGARVLDTFYGFYAPGDESTRVVGGIGWEVCQRLTDMGMAFERPNTYGAGTGVTYEPEALKLVWDDLLDEAGASVLFGSLMTTVLKDGDQVTGAIIDTISGPLEAHATIVIDATGDANVAWRAGAPLQDEIETLQPATMTFRVGGVGDSVPSKELQALMKAAAEAGDYDLPRVEGSVHDTCIPGVKHTNLTRVAGLDLTDPWQRSAAEREGRRQTQEYMRFLVDRVPGYENAYLLNTATRIGIRETRRLLGEYLLTRDDVLEARDHADGIARCGAPIEDHAAGAATRWEYVGGDRTGATYAVPFRCLVPREVTGLLVAGRCLSATHDAHASVRSIGQCMAMGQAAGVAAALCAKGDHLVADLDITTLRATLTDQGALL